MLIFKVLDIKCWNLTNVSSKILYDAKKIAEHEMDTNIVTLAPSVKISLDFFLPEKRRQVELNTFE